TYGVSDDADFSIKHVVKQRFSTSFIVSRPYGLCDLDITINMPGDHNVLNATAAVAVATDEGIDDKAIQIGLKNFQGVGRRFQLYGEFEIDVTTGSSIALVDDYGHHPTEVQATISAARQAWPDRRLLMIYQPHRYTRTKDLYEDFVKVLSTVDGLMLLEVYSAGEEPIAGADSRALCGSIRSRGKLEPVFVDSIDNVSDVLAGMVRPGDVVLTQGAGNVGSIAIKLASEMKSLENLTS
ncbi:MAG: UDP-N-acetylmuramate--alanine ligase, partial [Oceanicoccus sp.]